MILSSLAAPFVLSVLVQGEGFSRDFASPGIPKPPLAMCTFDDGRGPALYVGGPFEAAGGVIASRVARWDGVAWEALGEGPELFVQALAVFDDGSGAGPALFAGGAAPLVAGQEGDALHRWDGGSWTPVPSKLGNTGSQDITALAVYQGASGPELIAAGDFTEVDGVPVEGVARFDGVTWSPLGKGLEGLAVALAVHDDGTGKRPMLYASGHFSLSLWGVAKYRIARWDGTAWSKVGTLDGYARTLAVFDSGAGPELIAGGDFTQVGSLSVGGVASWNGTAWGPVGSGVGAMGAYGAGSVWATKVCESGRDGSTELVVGGIFDAVDGVAANNLAAWDGSRWRPVGDGVGGLVQSVESARFPGAHESRLFAAGVIGWGAGPHGIAAWDGTAWSSLTEGQGVWGAITDMLVHDDGSGPELYACGSLWNAGGAAIGPVTKWDGARWSSFGAPLFGPAECLSIFDDGSGPALYAGGGLVWIGDTYAGGTARWDGRRWEPVGGGVVGSIYAQAVYDDGSGAALYMAGDFQFAGPTNMQVGNIARWDGQSWGDLGGGVTQSVASLAVFDDGLGPALFAAGSFSHAGLGGQTFMANGFARWDGVAWSPVPGSSSQVEDMRVLDLGAGERLYLAGIMYLPTGQTAAVWSWDGSTWESVGDGAAGILSHGHSLGFYESDDATVLLVGGSSASEPGSSAVAQWDGSRWSEVVRTDGLVNAMESFHGGMYFGGYFTRVGDVPASRFAQWRPR